MNDTLAAPDPAQQVDQVRQLLTGYRLHHSCEATLQAIRQVVTPVPQPDIRPLATDEAGWPLLNAEGTAWERHDDPRV